jgi:hypothetical protein
MRVSVAVPPPPDDLSWLADKKPCRRRWGRVAAAVGDLGFGMGRYGFGCSTIRGCTQLRYTCGIFR